MTHEEAVKLYRWFAFKSRYWRQDENTEDLAQEFLLDICKEMRKGKLSFPMGDQVKQNTLIDAIRRLFGDSRVENENKKRKQSIYAKYIDTEEDLPPSRSVDPLVQISYSECLSKLDEKKRVIMVLYFEWGLTLKEIAHCLGITESRVSQHLTQIETKLRKEINHGKINQRQKDRKEKEEENRVLLERRG